MLHKHSNKTKDIYILYNSLRYAAAYEEDQNDH